MTKLRNLFKFMVLSVWEEPDGFYSLVFPARYTENAEEFLGNVLDNYRHKTLFI